MATSAIAWKELKSNLSTLSKATLFAFAPCMGCWDQKSSFQWLIAAGQLHAGPKASFLLYISPMMKGQEP
jgi:hypothetical protein